jgi:hypothetical protein
MARRWPKEMAWLEVVLAVENPEGGECGRRMQGRAQGHQRILTFEGPVQLSCQLRPGLDAAWPNHHRTCGPGQALTWALPRWRIGWDIFCWRGHRRFARHWSVPQLRLELGDSDKIVLSEDAIED